MGGLSCCSKSRSGLRPATVISCHHLTATSAGCKVPYAGVAVNEVAILRKGAGSDMEADLVALRPMSATALDVKRREW